MAQLTRISFSINSLNKIVLCVKSNAEEPNSQGKFFPFYFVLQHCFQPKDLRECLRAQLRSQWLPVVPPKHFVHDEIVGSDGPKHCLVCWGPSDLINPSSFPCFQERYTGQVVSFCGGRGERWGGWQQRSYKTVTQWRPGFWHHRDCIRPWTISDIMVFCAPYYVWCTAGILLWVISFRGAKLWVGDFWEVFCNHNSGNQKKNKQTKKHWEQFDEPILVWAFVAKQILPLPDKLPPHLIGWSALSFSFQSHPNEPEKSSAWSHSVPRLDLKTASSIF